jgi:glutamine---fructose-6-phosphate transaminase (isomerizing)
MNRCSRCIFPDTLPGVKLNAKGVCNYCESYTPITYQGEEKLLKVIEEAKAKKAKYDCLVPISGGRDSAYVLHTAKKYGLNILAVNYDNEFRSCSQVEKNVRNACEAVGVDLQMFKSKRDIARKIITQSVKASMNCGISSVFGSMCNACTYGFTAVTYLTAEKLNVPLIIWGSSKMEKTTHITGPALKAVLKGEKAPSLSRFHPKKLLLRYYDYLQRFEFPVPGNWKENIKVELPKLKNNNIREISLFDFLPWDRQAIKDTIINELGWKKPEHAKTTWRTDCKLEKLIAEYAYMNMFTCTKRCFGFHNMINESQMTREEALAVEESATSVLTDDLRELLRSELQLSAKEVDYIASFEHK